MKKKMTVLGVLLMAVMVSAYSVSGTYAKYVSSVDVTDEARVAKWQLQYTDKDNGLTDVTAATTTQEINLFKESYTFNGKTYAESLSNGKIVAPGLKGEYTFELGGTFETRFTLGLELVKDNSYNTVGLGTNNSQYDPLRFQVETAYKTSAWVTYAELNDALEAAFAINTNGDLREFDPGIYTAANMKEPVTIRWAWAYDATDAAIISSTTDCDDEYDTLLGNKASDGEDLEVKLTIKATATQVQNPDYIQ